MNCVLVPTGVCVRNRFNQENLRPHHALARAGGNGRRQTCVAPAPGSPPRAVFARWGGGSPAGACFLKKDASAQARVNVPHDTGKDRTLNSPEVPGMIRLQYLILALSL